MNPQESSELVIELAKSLVDLVRVVAPGWEKAFYRFESDGLNTRTNASYAIQGEARIFDVMKYRSAFLNLKNLGEKLRDSLENNGDNFKVFLLTVNEDMSFEVEYDHHDSGRWKISKVNGGTGFPGA